LHPANEAAVEGDEEVALDSNNRGDDMIVLKEGRGVLGQHSRWWNRHQNEAGFGSLLAMGEQGVIGRLLKQVPLGLVKNDRRGTGPEEPILADPEELARSTGWGSRS